MAENENQPGSKNNDSLADRVLRARRNSTAKPGQVVCQPEGALTPTEKVHVPGALVIQPPDYSKLGPVAKIRAHMLEGKAALEAFSLVYKGQLDVLKAQVEQAVKARQTGIAAAAEAYFFQLDGEHVRNLSEFGVENAALRWEAVTKLTAMSVAKVREVENQPTWPEDIRIDTIDRIFAIRMQVSDDIMAAVGQKYSK